MVTKTIDDYLKLPYTIEVVHDVSDDHDVWFGRVLELPGCMTEADSFDELGFMVRDAMAAWIETALEDGQPVPEPRPTEEYSGKFMVRVPRSLHRELSEGAEREGVSLNAFLSVALARAVSGGNPTGKAELRELPGPTWPQLSDPAWHAMSLAGLRTEAREIDEKLFANWLGNLLDQMAAADEGGYVRDELAYAEQMRQALQMTCSGSPLMAVFCQAVELLAGKIEEGVQLKEGLVQQTLLQQGIRRQVQERSQAFLQERRRAVPV